MKKVISSKELSRGVFWIIEDEVYSYPFYQEDSLQNGISKSGLTYNHKSLWDDVKPKNCNKPYNYYPRGRVEISNSGHAIIYTSPFTSRSNIKEIRKDFGIVSEPEIRYDHSTHYKCYLDDDWKPDR